MPWHNRRRFDAHLRFVTGEVMPWAGQQFGLVDGPWVAAGFSNGAAWAIGAAQRRPELIGAVAGLSAGAVPHRISGAARAARVPHYLAAGTLEPPFRRATRSWAERGGPLVLVGQVVPVAARWSDSPVVRPDQVDDVINMIQEFGIRPREWLVRNATG